MTDKILNIICTESGKRLDSFLAANFSDNITRSGAQKLIAKQKVTVNNEIKPKNHKIVKGDIVSVILPQKQNNTPLPLDIPLEIIFEDSHIAIINKPRGMVVHPGAGNETDTLVNALLFHYGINRLSDLNSEERPGIVHRIDKDTSGLLVIAKNNQAHEGLAKQFFDHSITRTYYAVCVGHFKEYKGTIDAPLARNTIDRKKMCITEKNSKKAITHYEVLEEFKGYSLLKLNLETGRTHQIRVHMASLNHPVAGDKIYGLKKGINLNGQCLHAKELGFIHPITGENMFFNSKLPSYFENFLNKLRKIR